MIDASSRSTRWRVSMVRSSPEFVAGSNCTKSASCSSPHGHVPDVEKRPEAVVDPPRGEAMGRWQPVGLTEGLWREVAAPPPLAFSERRSEEHTSELQSLMRISYAGFCLKKKKI